MSTRNSELLSKMQAAVVSFFCLEDVSVWEDDLVIQSSVMG